MDFREGSTLQRYIGTDNRFTFQDWNVFNNPFGEALLNQLLSKIQE